MRTWKQNWGAWKDSVVLVVLSLKFLKNPAEDVYYAISDGDMDLRVETLQWTYWFRNHQYI